VAGVSLNVSVLLPFVAPKFVPVIVTGQFTGPAAGFTLLIAGGTGFGAMTREG
jgi:hypothetical protein